MRYIYLSVDDLINIHATILELTGGTPGIANRGILEACYEKPKTKIGQREIFPDIISKAAALMEAIIKWHPFIDGNKRTALQAIKIFLDDNGYDFKLNSRTIEICIKIAKCELSNNAIKEWIGSCI